MRVIVLVLMWLTPAILAAILGWKGISGYGSAFAEYLVPLPLAGGMFHIPSFALAASVILSTRNLPASICRYMPVLAFAVLLIALSLQLEFERIYSWLLTDYKPAGSAFRFDNNPLYEEDRSIVTHQGYFDCFVGHETVDEKVQTMVASETTGLGKDIDYWYAYARLCEGVTIPERYNRDIALLSICSGIRRAQSRSVEKFVQKYGDNSEQLLFVRNKSKSLGLE